MFQHTGLDELIFGSRSWEADELIIVSGYISPNPVQRCKDLPFKVTIICGMITESGISPADHEFFKGISKPGCNVQVLYSIAAEVHAKLYLWSLSRSPKSGLLGSANFTWPGLNSSGREVLMEIPNQDLAEAGKYAYSVLKNSVSCLDPRTDAFVSAGPTLHRLENEAPPPPTASAGTLSLLNSQTGSVPDSSGINWGFAAAHVTFDDAYLPISVNLVRGTRGLIPPKPAIANTPVELLWDDGTVMVGYLEGSQTIEGKKYPKQLASHPEKSILGKYLRKRLGVPEETKVTMAALTRYGRKDVGISLLAPGRYFLDFAKR